MADSHSRRYFDPSRGSWFRWLTDEGCFIDETSQERFLLNNNQRQPVDLRPRTLPVSLPDVQTSPRYAPYGSSAAYTYSLDETSSHPSEVNLHDQSSDDEDGEHTDDETPHASRNPSALYLPVTLGSVDQPQPTFLTSGSQDILRNLGNFGVRVPEQRQATGTRESQAASRIPRHIGPTGKEFQRLDPDFRRPRDPQQFFHLGCVFRTLWFEPAGEINGDDSSLTTDTRFGENGYAKIRWFIVIREARDFCWCLSIKTYHFRGLAKGSIEKSEHAIVYTGERPPRLQPDEEPRPGERPLRPPIKVNPAQIGRKMREMSRLSYARVYTVEHNIKVKRFGTVDRACIPDMVAQFREVSGGNPALRLPHNPQAQSPSSRQPVTSAVNQLQQAYHAQTIGQLQRQIQAQGQAQVRPQQAQSRGSGGAPLSSRSYNQQITGQQSGTQTARRAGASQPSGNTLRQPVVQSNAGSTHSQAARSLFPPNATIGRIATAQSTRVAQVPANIQRTQAHNPSRERNATPHDSSQHHFTNTSQETGEGGGPMVDSDLSEASGDDGE